MKAGKSQDLSEDLLSEVLLLYKNTLSFNYKIYLVPFLGMFGETLKDSITGNTCSILCTWFMDTAVSRVLFIPYSFFMCFPSFFLFAVLKCTD